MHALLAMYRRSRWVLSSHDADCWKDMHSTQRAYLGVRARAFRIYREIAGGENFKISDVFKWTLFNISVVASQYFKVSVFKNLEIAGPSHNRVICEPPEVLRTSLQYVIYASN
jgi:hypothetical protein